MPWCILIPNFLIFYFQSVKEVLAERNTPESKQFHSLDSFARESYTERRAVGESGVNIDERDVIDHLNFSSIPSLTEADLISFVSCASPQSCSFVEKENYSTSNKTDFDKSSEESCKLVNLLKENECLKLELKEKLAVIRDLQITCEELEKRGAHLKETGTDALKVSLFCCKYCSMASRMFCLLF